MRVDTDSVAACLSDSVFLTSAGCEQAETLYKHDVSSLCSLSVESLLNVIRLTLVGPNMVQHHFLFNQVMKRFSVKLIRSSEFRVQ